MLNCVLVIYKRDKKFYSTLCVGAFVGQEREIKEKDIDNYIVELRKDYPNLEIKVQKE